MTRIKDSMRCSTYSETYPKRWKSEIRRAAGQGARNEAAIGHLRTKP